MKVFYEIFILTFLILYSALSIALLGPWIFRKARALMPAGRPSFKGMAKAGQWQKPTRKERKALGSLLAFIALIVLLSACAQRPLSTREQGALTGAGLGAATGAIIGGATGGNAGTGAAIGAGLGLLTGALVGGAIENQRGETAYPPAPSSAGSPQPTGAAPLGHPQASVGPSHATADPTVGQFVNGTRWRLRVFVDANSNVVETASAITLNPQESRQHNLDLGPHRIIAQAFVDTQFGTRAVGRSEQTIEVDSRGSGWTLRFHESDFR